VSGDSSECPGCRRVPEQPGHSSKKLKLSRRSRHPPPSAATVLEQAPPASPQELAGDAPAPQAQVPPEAAAQIQAVSPRGGDTDLDDELLATFPLSGGDCVEPQQAVPVNNNDDDDDCLSLDSYIMSDGEWMDADAHACGARQDSQADEREGQCHAESEARVACPCCQADLSEVCLLVAAAAVPPPSPRKQLTPRVPAGVRV
jgi:hypothetical protein